jgi:flagellar hook-length control protein FliK
MNAARPVSQLPSSNDPPPLNLSLNAPAAPSCAPHAKSQDFAGALTEANAKPDHKSGPHKSNSASASGSPLPVAGNTPPPAAAPPPAATSSPTTAKTVVEKIAAGAVTGNASNGIDQAAAVAAAAVAATAASAVAGAPGVASAAANALPSAPAITGQSPPNAASSAPTQNPAPWSVQLPPVAAFGNTGSIDPALGAAGGKVAAATSGATEVDPAFATAAFAPAAPATSPAASTAPPSAPVDALPARTARIAEPTATTAQNIGDLQRNSDAPNNPAAQPDANAQSYASALSDTTSPANTVSSTNVPPSDAGAAAVQSIMASVIQSGASHAPTSPTATADDLPTPAVASAAPATALVAALASRPAAASAAAAARTASNAQVVSAHAGAASIDVTAGAAQSAASTGATTDIAPAPTLNVTAGVGSAEFGQGVADRVSLMVDSNLTSAKLQVNPPALGPIEVKIALQAGHAQVWLTSHSAVTREALESSSPKLREMLGAQGFSQVSVDISQRSFQDRTPPSKGYEAMPSIDDGGIPALSPGASVLRAASGLLDAYA